MPHFGEGDVSSDTSCAASIIKLILFSCICSLLKRLWKNIFYSFNDFNLQKSLNGVLSVSW